MNHLYELAPPRLLEEITMFWNQCCTGKKGECFSPGLGWDISPRLFRNTCVWLSATENILYQICNIITGSNGITLIAEKRK